MKTKTSLLFLLVFLSLPLSVKANPVKIRSCVDGDTCTVQTEGFSFRVRLIGIDAPEMGHNRVAAQPFAREARAALNKMAAGKTLNIRQHGLDPHNRPLVVIEIDKETANEKMVQQGLAAVYEGFTDYDLTRLKALQAQAQKEKIGIWSLGPRYTSPYLYRKKHRASWGE